MRIGSPVSIQRAAYYTPWYGAPPRVVQVRAREERRAAPTLPPAPVGDAARLTLFIAQTLRAPRAIDLAASHAAYGAVDRADESILISLDA